MALNDTFQYNGSIPSTINYNGSSVNILKYNGTVVWKKPITVTIYNSSGTSISISNGLSGSINNGSSASWTEYRYDDSIPKINATASGYLSGSWTPGTVTSNISKTVRTSTTSTPNTTRAGTATQSFYNDRWFIYILYI